MDRMAQLYELWKSQGVAGDNLAFWQEFYVKFYQAFIEADRWKQYLEGVGTTLLVTGHGIGHWRSVGRAGRHGAYRPRPAAARTTQSPFGHFKRHL